MPLLPADPDTSALRTEFQAISMTLRAATAAKNPIHPTLIPLHTDSLEPSLGSSRTSEITKSLALLVVRGREAVVVASVHPQLAQKFYPSEFVVVAQDVQGRYLDEERRIDIEDQRTAWAGEQDRDGKFITGKRMTSWQSAKRSILANFPIFNNAAITGHHFHKDSRHRVKLVETAQSHWPAIYMRDSAAILDPNNLSLPRNDPLENHIATTTDFINAYRQTQTEYDRGKLFWQFSAYLSRVSWPKTFRRLMNWTSKGFIGALVSIPLEKFESIVAVPGSSKHSNRSLYIELSKLSKDAVDYLLGLLSPIESLAQLRPRNLEDLMRALDEERSKNYTSTDSIYNENPSIRIQIHCLLIALFIAYMKALKERDEIHKKEGEILEAEMKSKSKKGKSERVMQNVLKKINGDEEMMRRKKDSQVRIWDYGRILWAVTSSRMFDDYLRSLEGALLPVTPGTTHMWLFERMGLADECPGRFAGQSQWDHDGDGDENDQRGVEDVEEEQMREITLHNSNADPIVRFKSWTRLITSYFVALRKVASAVRNKPQTFVWKFIVAKRCSSQVPLTLNWPNTIRQLCTHDGANQSLSTATPSVDDLANNSGLQSTFNKDSKSRADGTHFTVEQAEKAITVLQGHINRDRKTFATFGTSSASLDLTLSLNTDGKKKPAPIQTGMVVWTGFEHCEAIAAALFLYPDQVILEDQEDLRKLILLINTQDVSFSHLCCPLCWELLQILRPSAFRMCRFHTSLRPLELPCFLPQIILEEMVIRLRRHLRRELITLLEGNMRPTPSDGCFFTETVRPPIL